MSRKNLTIWSICLWALAGCDGAPPAPHVSRARAAEPARPDPSVLRLPLGQRLLRESKARPSLGVRGEDLRQNMEARGVHFVRTRQVLGEPLSAAYCEASLSQAGLSVSLCEFADHQAAEAGRARSAALFDALIRGRELVVHENALLTLAGTNQGEAGEERKLVASAFKALLPRSREHI
jgi:hypothetical protein